MAYNSEHGVSLGILKDSLTRAKTEWLAAIAKTGHAKFQKVDAVPEAAITAQYHISAGYVAAEETEAN